MKNNRWIIDRRVPVAVVLMLFMQMTGALIWATELDARVGNIEQQTVAARDFREKFARIEERLEYMRQDMEAIKRQLEYLTEKLIGK